MPKIVIIESPYSGDLILNVQYARLALRDSIDRGEVPFAGHLLYTQALDDSVPDQRAKGMDCAEQIVHVLAAGVNSAHAGTSIVCAVYDNLGISPGMKQGIEWAAEVGAKVEFRQIKDWPHVNTSKNVTNVVKLEPASG